MTDPLHPRVSIIILNWNGWRDTIECLESLYRIEYSNYDVIVIDNGSRDDSVRRIKEYAQGKLRVSSKFFEYNPENKPIKVFELTGEEAVSGKFNRSLYEKYDPDRRLILVRNRENLGYTGGNNIGMKFVLSVLNPDHVLLLNNDTVVAQDFLRILVEASRESGRSWIFGPRIMYYINPRETQFLGAKYSIRPFFKRVFNSLPENVNGLKIPTDEVHGAAMMINRDVLLRIGLLDEDYFAYWDETDFCLRAKRERINLYSVPSSTVWHKIGSQRKNGKLSPLAVYLFGRNMVRLLYKNFEGFNRLISILFIVSIFAPFLLVSYLIYHRDFKALLMFGKGLFDGLFGKKWGKY